MKLPDTTMFENIIVLNCDELFFKKPCCYCDNLATKAIIRTCIHSGKTQKIYVCNCCYESEITGIKKYMRKEED